MCYVDGFGRAAILSLNAPEPKAQVHYCVVQSPVGNSSHFRLLLWNHWTDFNESYQEARSQRPLPCVCFSGRSEKQDGRPASDWLRYFRHLLFTRLTEFNDTKKARSQRPHPSLCFFWPIRKTRWPPGLWFAETFSTSPLKPLNRIQRNLKEAKSQVLYHVCAIEPIGKTR